MVFQLIATIIEGPRPDGAFIAEGMVWRDQAMRSTIGLTVTAALIVTAVACGGSVAAAPPKTVTATVSEFKIGTDAPKVMAGEVTFTITNKGSAVHEFVVVRTDMAPDALPKDADGLVAEGGALTVVDEVEDIAPGASKTLKVTLEPGKYAFFCNLSGHYVGGMRGGVEAVAASAAR
jgi:uncharacterized cupredoxin-like copper-binding protein